jgi:hypothetical protein
MGVLIQLAVGAQVEEPARGVIRSRSKGLTVGEELHGVDVRFVAQEGLHALSCADVPHLGCGIAGSRDKDLLLRGQ